MTKSGASWTETCLVSFHYGSDGDILYAGLIFDPSGNLYGATSNSGTGGGGTVFELTPSGNCWTLKTLYSFTGGSRGGPYATLVMDGAGNLYGTTGADDASQQGNVFKLTPSGSSWMYTSLHDFTGGADGGSPNGGVTLDKSSNLYGTAIIGGADGYGVVWEITP